MQKPLPPGGNGFRYELHYRKARKIAAALGWQGNLTLANLMQQDVFAHLASALLKSWQQIHLPPTMDLQGLNIDERALLIAGSEPGFWEAVKQQTPSATYKRKRALFHRLQKQQEAPQAATPHTVAVRQELTAALPPGHQI